MIAVIALPVVLACGANPLRSAMQFDTTPLRLGLTPDQDALVQGIMTHTNAQARILIEEIVPESRPDWNWTALLPTITERAYLGGLDADAHFEHSHCGLMSNRINGRQLDAWSDSDLADLARRYNIGWVLVRSLATEQRFRAAGAKEIARWRDGGDVVCLELNRKTSFILAGQAKWEQADLRKVVLTDVIPADAPHPDGGPVPAKVIVLSLHHQPGLKVSPNIVLVERDPDAHDPIPMIRLRMTGPLSRIVISWENR